MRRTWIVLAVLATTPAGRLLQAQERKAPEVGRAYRFRPPAGDRHLRQLDQSRRRACGWISDGNHRQGRRSHRLRPRICPTIQFHGATANYSQKEVRRGQRTTLFVDLDVPEAPGQRVTVAATHLENWTKPKVRRQQMEQLLKEIYDIPNPVVVAGDMNTTGGDSTPTSIENMLYKRYGSVDFWTTKGVQWATGVGLVCSAAKTARKLSGIQYQIEPTSANIPGAAPNLERGLFGTVEKFHFEGGKALDFRVVAERTSNGRSGTLGSKGFAPTFNAELI